MHLVKGRFTCPLAAILLALSVSGPATAAGGSISVSPTRLEVPPAVSQASMVVRAEGSAATYVQVRVFRWSEGTPPSEVTATRDVVVSPPITELKPRQELTVRILRVARRKPRGRECYRVLVDKLPDQTRRQSTIDVLIRHNVPLCFTS